MNVSYVADAFREARNEARRTDAVLARAEGLLSGNGKVDVKSIATRFPRLPAHRVHLSGGAAADMLKDTSEWIEVKTAGEVRQGEPVNEKHSEMVAIPAALIDKNEI